MNWLHGHRTLLRVVALVVPLALTGCLYLLGPAVPASAAALLVVLVVVGAAATGDRACGILAGVAGAIGFDFFLTAPYLDLHITNSEDIELAVLLLLVGLVVNELALWGGRQRAVASERQGFIDGVLESADLAAGSSGRAPETVIAGHIQRTLGAEQVTYRPGAPDSESAVVARDGAVRCGGLLLDPERDGLPIDRFTAVPVARNDVVVGHFRVSAATRLARPRPEQLRVAALLADQLPVAGLTARSDTRAPVR